MIKRAIDKLKRDGFLALLVAVKNYPFRAYQRRLYKNMLNQDKIADRFSEIYKQNLWSSVESGSGEGSEVGYTEPLRDWLVENVPKYDVKQFVDAPCGDFNWMKLVLPKLDINYVGLDIVSSVIDSNNHLYATSAIKF